jgi:hypothetical protein
MTHRRLPLAIGIAVLFGTLAGCAETPMAPVGPPPHLLIDYAISRDVVRDVAPPPRFESMMRRMSPKHAPW